MYVNSMFKLHISAAQGHLQATQCFKEPTALRAWTNSALKARRCCYH
jgi:hypothetical protein